MPPRVDARPSGSIICYPTLPQKGGDKAPKGDGDDGPSMEQLLARISELELEKEEEAKQRSYMQLERDKINQFWEVRRCLPPASLP